MASRTDSDFALSLQGFRPTTLEIMYYMPDHPSLLQQFIWQTMDLAPKFPRAHAFLQFWSREIHAVIHSVNVAWPGAQPIVVPWAIQPPPDPALH